MLAVCVYTTSVLRQYAYFLLLKPVTWLGNYTHMGTAARIITSGEHTQDFCGMAAWTRKMQVRVGSLCLCTYRIEDGGLHKPGYRSHV
jgi:hypothetical protein